MVLKTLLDIPRRNEIKLRRAPDFLATFNTKCEQRMFDLCSPKKFFNNDKEKSAIMNSDSEDLPHNRYQETCILPAIVMMVVVLLGCGIIWYLRRLDKMYHHLKNNIKVC